MKSALPSGPSGQRSSSEIFFSGSLPYPLTITRARYGGTYEAGDWIAFADDQIPGEAIADDVTCARFWAEVGANSGVIERGGRVIAVGVGATAVEAVNLCAAIASVHNAQGRTP